MNKMNIAKLLVSTFVTTVLVWYSIWVSAVVLLITGVQDAAFGFMLAAILTMMTASGYTGWKAKAVYDDTN